MESEIILEEWSPVCNIQAFVEKTDKTYYFEEKVAFCKKFWNYFDTEYWSEVQESHLKTLDNFFGTHEKYYAIDGGKFPPKALITGRKDGVIYGITVGVSMIPMPKVEMSYQDNYTEYRRMELGFACTEEKEELMKSMLGTISGLTNLPWRELTFLGHGHTIPISHIEGYQYILFLNANEMQESAPKYDTFWSERINLLWLKLIKEEEYQCVCEKGVAAYLDEYKEESIHVMKTGVEEERK